MKKTKDTNKGITLIALVITIIVMLILVAVTITMAVNGGLFEYAGRAGSQTNEAVKAEQELGSGRIKVGNFWYDSPQDYVDGIKSANQGEGTGNEGDKPEETGPITFTVDGVSYSAETGDTWVNWADFARSGFIAKGDYVYVGDKSDSKPLFYDDGTKVEMASSITARTQILYN